MITTLHRIWGVMGRHRSLLIRGILATFVEAVFMSLPVGALYLLLIGYEDVSAATVWGITAMLLVGAIGQIACRWYITTRINPLGFVAMADERMRIGARLRRSPMGYFNRTRLGEIASVLTTTMVDAEMWLVWQFLQVVTGVIDVVVISAFLLALDWRIGAVSLLVLVLALAALMIVDRRSDATMGERQRVQAGFVDVVLEFIRGIAVSRAFSMTGVARERMHRAAAEVSRTSLAAEAKIIPFSSLYQFVFKIGTVAMLGLGATLRINGDIDLPRALLFGVAAFVVYQTLEGLNSNVTMLELVAASLDLIEPVRTAPVMEARASREEPGSRKQPAEAAGRDIVFTDVSFAYEDRRVVDHVDCSIPSGSVCALVGPSGSGKTTLCNLMMRFWDVDSGSISVGGVDVRDQDPEDLLSLFAVVFQDVFLFSDTVARGRAPRPLPGLRRGPPRWLRHRPGRRRGEPVGRRAPAHLDSQGAAQGRPHRHPRRGDQLGGPGERTRAPGGAAGAVRGEDAGGHRPQPRHRDRRRPDPGAGRRTHRRKRPSRGPREGGRHVRALPPGPRARGWLAHRPLTGRQSADRAAASDTARRRRKPSPATGSAGRARRRGLRRRPRVERELTARRGRRRRQVGGVTAPDPPGTLRTKADSAPP